MAARVRAFLDANVLRGQLTTDVILTLAHPRLLTPEVVGAGAGRGEA
jgi:hypothetical protein